MKKTVLPSLLALTLSLAAQAANIVDPIPGEAIGSPAASKEFEVNVKNEDGNDQALLYRLYRYGAVTQKAPLLVQVHEWGGHFARMESITKYEKSGLPFVMLAFQWKNVTDNQRNWWYGRVNIASKKTVPFIHNEIIRITRQVMATDIAETSIGSSVDSNRVYVYGHSIGGTGAVQIGMRHPEVFAAVSVNAGWTTFDDLDRPGGVTNQYRSAFLNIIGSTAGLERGFPVEYPDEEGVTIAVNADQPHLAPGAEMKAYLYTNLAHYFSVVRNPAWPSPPVFIAQGAADNVTHQGDNLVPVLEAQRRAYTYNRTADGHEGGGVTVKMDKLYKFRRDQSYLAFTSRDYGMNKLTEIGYFNDLRARGWDPETIVDEPTRYSVKLTGTGTSDVTLHRLQKLPHNPGTTYAVKLNGADAGSAKADEFGLVTLSKVKDAALIELAVTSVGLRRSLAGTGFHAAAQYAAGGPGPEGFAFTGLPAGARLSVLDLGGRTVASLGTVREGRARWDGRDGAGRRAPGGVYFLKVDAAAGPALQKLILAPR